MKQFTIAKTKYVPLIQNFYATTIFKAFVLNALAVALISTFAVEIRKALNDVKGRFYLFVNPLFSGSDLNEKQKSVIVALASFAAAMLVYVIMFLIFGFGAGMLSSGHKATFF